MGLGFRVSGVLGFLGALGALGIWGSGLGPGLRGGVGGIVFWLASLQYRRDMPGGCLPTNSPVGLRNVAAIKTALGNSPVMPEP